MADFNDTSALIPNDDKKALNAASREKRKENVARWKEAFQATLAESGEQIKEVMSSRSNDIEVTAALTFGEPKVIARKLEDGSTSNEPVANVVGYAVRNNSQTPINATTTKCELVDGVYVKNAVPTVIAPGATVALRKADFMTLMFQPEFSFTASNGKVTTRTFTGSAQPTAAELEAYIEKHNFVFANAKVPDMCQSISTNVDGVDTVINEYKEIFAYLENKAEKKTRQAGPKAPAFTPQELAANYVRRLYAGLQ